MRYINERALTESFTALRRRRFISATNRYDNELKARFRNETDTDLTTPERRYQAVGYNRDTASAGAILTVLENQVRTRLIDEYAGLQAAPVAAGQVAAVLPPADRKQWAPFNYEGELAGSYFAPIVHRNQLNWFEPTPRCLKCRVIHDYNILNEDLQVKAVPNKSCQCAEDIVYVKLRELHRVGNVVLANL